MNVFIIRHVVRGNTWYRAKGDNGIVWSSSLDEAEPYTEDDFPLGFENMAVSVDVIDGKLVML